MLPDTIVAGCLIVLLLSIIGVIIKLRLRGYNALSGVPPIHGLAFITGKLAMAATIITMLVDALGWRGAATKIDEFTSSLQQADLERVMHF